MASFVEGVWSSIFTPGPTPTLLVATNATFAALQVLLFALLLATYSIHFVVLSFLCGALWWSINWFAREVRETQAREEEKERQREKLLAEKSKQTAAAAAADTAGDESSTTGAAESTDESETETESLDGGERSRVSAAPAAPAPAPAAAATSAAARPVEATATTLQPQQLSPGDDGFRKRRSIGDGSGYISTDSEWEKVDDKAS